MAKPVDDRRFFVLQEKDGPMPNILFIYLDDLGYGDVSCYNARSKIQTPHIDSLATAGLIFTDAHTPASICGPSRYGLMTGRYPWRRPGGTSNGDKWRDVFIEEGRLTIASVLKQKDYNTAQMGKWGLRHNYSDAVKPGMAPGTKDAYDFPNKSLLGSMLFGFDYAWVMTHLYVPEGETSVGNAKVTFENGQPVDPELGLDSYHDWLPQSGAKVVEYIETYAGARTYPAFGIDDTKPFFIYWDPPSPHLPLVPNAEFVGTSDAGEYGDFVQEIDHWVGEMLDALETHGLAQNTMVVFSSDNGPENICYNLILDHGHYSMGDLRGVKQDTWEGGHRVPLIVRWPGVVQPDTTCDALVGIQDWMATIAEITGQVLPSNAAEDSVSILPLLLGQTPSAPVRESIIHHTPSGKYAIRRNGWVFIDHSTGTARSEPSWFSTERGVIPHSHPGELFDLTNDPQQTTNRYGDESALVNELKDLMSEIR